MRDKIRKGKDEPRMDTDGHGWEGFLVIRVHPRFKSASRNLQSAIEWGEGLVFAEAGEEGAGAQNAKSQRARLRSRRRSEIGTDCQTEALKVGVGAF